jgi:hypothetical protein
MMIDRDRAWRRRKARTALYQAEAKKNAIFRPDDEEAVVTTKATKQHRHGALTHAQAMRQESALGQQVQDGLD